MKLKFIATFTLVINVFMLFAPISSAAQAKRKIQSPASPTVTANHSIDAPTSPIISNPNRRTQTAVIANNYIGAGITTSGLAAYSKFALSEDFSLRPQILFDDLNEDFNGTVVIPVTYDFNSVGRRVAPFVGIGGGSQTRNFDVGMQFTTGLDYALSSRFTATGLFNIQLFDDNDINAIFGLGFNF